MGESAAAVAAEVDQGVAAGDIAIKVDTGSDSYLDLFINPNSTFAELKSVIAKETGLKPEEQKLLFRGKEMDDHEQLHMAGVKGNAKIILIENLPTKNEDLENVDRIEEVNEKVEEVNENVEEAKETIKEVSRGVEAVNKIREENNQFAEQVASLEAVVCSGIQVADKDFVFLTEMLMRQLLKLDGIDAEGEGRTQRKLEVRRVQGLVDTLDNLRTKNANPSNDAPKPASGEVPMPSSL
ncbi:molecular chaperone regulator BAG-1, Ubiquitin-related domain protein [Artemisia annua]|uniref:Molecular chaperone regulator BAG-1, Ubiquitin-related domain protein n=1 Tax=Artemisia annua TaxID=35608 RepID=A0A2U1MF16_ARTAN|nr:molecular chaperone regulator BAG-1, Ubiquitin-related domain protein [Artemisia annua]